MNQGQSFEKIIRIDLGMNVEIEMVALEGAERLVFDIVPDEYADIRLGYLGIHTPIAQSILNHVAGDTIPYFVDDISQIRILAVRPSRSGPSKEVAQRREENLRKAIDQSDRSNAIAFASSFSGKWGDYDPSSFVEDEKEEKPDGEDNRQT